MTLTYPAKGIDERSELGVEGSETEGGRVRDLGDGEHCHAENEATGPHE